MTKVTIVNHKIPDEFPFFKPMKELKSLNWFQRFILNRKFVKIAIREAEIQAFPKALADLKETNVYETDIKADELAEQKMSALLHPVDLRKIVTLDKARGIVYIGGEKAEDARLMNLKQEADFILQSDLWTLLQETPKELAQRSMFVQGETLTDMQKGKSVLYTLSTQNNIVQTFKGYIPKASKTTIPIP